MRSLGYCLDALITLACVFAAYGITESYWQAAIIAACAVAWVNPPIFRD